MTEEIRYEMTKQERIDLIIEQISKDVVAFKTVLGVLSWYRCGVGSEDELIAAFNKYRSEISGFTHE